MVGKRNNSVKCMRMPTEQPPARAQPEEWKMDEPDREGWKRSRTEEGTMQALEAQLHIHPQQKRMQ